MNRWVLAGGGLVLLMLLGLWARPKGPYEHGFHNRAVAPDGFFRRFWPQDLPPVVVQQHDAVTNQVLMIRDLKVVKHAYFASPSSGPWSFAGVIRRAFQVGQVPQGTAEAGLVKAMQATLSDEFSLAGDQFNSAWNSTALEAAPVHLLAIVNRLDLAHIDQTGVYGAEVRFVYEALHKDVATDFLKLIVEFVLPAITQKDSQTIAQSWMALENLSMDPDGSGKYPFQDALKTLVDQLTARAAKVRLRANGADSSHTWEPREFLFQNTGLVPGRLEREPHIAIGQCQGSKLDLGKFAAAMTQPILDSEYQYDNWPSPQSQPLVCFPQNDDNTCLNTIAGVDKHVLVLGKDVLSDSQRDDVRFSLSVNSCTACHGSETSTGVFQIGPRYEGKQASQLSGFLTGAAGCGPSDAPILTYCTAPINTYSSPKGCQGVAKKDRSFNDLLRRHLFVYTVQQLDPAASWQTWRAALLPFTAYQVH